jgi:hypothetical protein
MEDLTGRYLRQLKESNWFHKHEPHLYFEIVSTVDHGMVRVKHPQHGISSMDNSRFRSCEEFELMPVGWTPEKVVNQYQIY